MLKVGVKMPAVTVKLGDYLADITALEAAGADSVWLHEGADQKRTAPTGAQLETWILLGAMAAVTYRIRLGAMLDPAGAWAPEHVASAVNALGRLSGGRLVLGVPAGGGLQNQVDLLIAARADSRRPAILVACEAYSDAERYELTADGAILLGADEQGEPDFPAGKADFQLWIEVPIPADRAAWAAMMAAHETAGATGVIVAWDPRLIDLLRNAGEPDDRTDLLIATG